MQVKKKIIQVIDTFYVNCVEEFKEAELKIANDSKFRSMFRKKDYDGNIQVLRDCKSAARSLRFPSDEITRQDQDTTQIVRMTETAIRQFNRLCDSYIQLQLALKKKAEGGDMPYSEYKQVYHRTQEDRVEMNNILRELDILYTDYTEDEDLDFYEFL